MRLEVLGGHGSETLTTRTVGILIDDEVLLEAGTAASVLTLERQRKINSVIISHAHLDHVKDLPFLVDNRIGETAPSMTVFAIDRVLEDLRKHLFNNCIWPDFTRIYNGESPLLRFETLHSGVSTQIGDLEVTPHAVNHVIPSVGLLLQKRGKALLYTGDTCSTEAIWKAAGSLAELSAILIEASFPEAMQQIAKVSGHMTPSMLLQDLRKLNRPEVPVYIFHMKPNYETTIVGALRRELKERLHVLQEGDIIQL